MEPSHDEILKALEQVIDPELRRPVTELDMVRDVRIRCIRAFSRLSSSV